MNNDNRTAIYLRDRTRLTPAQRRRVAKHEHTERRMLRAARRDVLKAERRRRLAIRSMFTRRAA